MFKTQVEPRAAGERRTANCRQFVYTITWKKYEALFFVKKALAFHLTLILIVCALVHKSYEPINAPEFDSNCKIEYAASICSGVQKYFEQGIQGAGFRPDAWTLLLFPGIRLEIKGWFLKKLWCYIGGSLETNVLFYQQS